MASTVSPFSNNPLAALARSKDILLAVGMVSVVGMMIVPLPPMIVDLAITLNISVALAIVVTTLYLPRPLDFSAFPSLLLLTTLFRLAINISVTRLVLLHGERKCGVGGHVLFLPVSREGLTLARFPAEAAKRNDGAHNTPGDNHRDLSWVLPDPVAIDHHVADEADEVDKW